MNDEQLLRNIGGIKAETKKLHLFRIDEPLKAQNTSSGVIRFSKATLLESNGNGLRGYVVTYKDEIHTFEFGRNAQLKYESLIDKVIFNR